MLVDGEFGAMESDRYSRRCRLSGFFHLFTYGGTFDSLAPP